MLTKRRSEFGENYRERSRQLLHKEIARGFNQPPQHVQLKPGVQMSYEQEIQPFWIKGQETGWKKEAFQTSGILWDETLELSTVDMPIN